MGKKSCDNLKRSPTCGKVQRGLTLVRFTVDINVMMTKESDCHISPTFVRGIVQWCPRIIVSWIDINAVMSEKECGNIKGP